MQQQLNSSEIWTVRFSALLVFIVSLCSMFYVLLSDNYAEHEEEIDKLIIFVKKVQKKSLVTITKLHNIKNTDCTSAHLTQMARIHSQQTLIQNITYIQQQDGVSPLVCSIAEQITQAFISDIPTREKPVKISTLNGQSYITSKYGQYFITYSANMTDFILELKLPHEFVFISNEGIEHINGKKGLFTVTETKISDWFINANFSVAKCSSIPGYCAVMVVPLADFLTEYAIVLVCIFVLSIALTYLSFRQGVRLYAKKRTIITRVKSGLTKGHFYPLFQPIIDMNTRQTTGCEILARYQDLYGVIYPDQFIPIIEQLGKTWEFTELMLEMTAKELQKLTCLSESFRVNINIFPQDIANNNIEELITLPAIMNTPCQFVAEITENQLLELECAQLNLAKLTEQGIGVAIDDFGTGYSNLQLIQKLNCHFLKVDRSFVMDLEEGSVRSSLIPNIIDMAKQNNLKVVAEGIENEQQYLILRRMGVHCGQGWLFAKAMTAEKLEEFTAASA